MTTPSQTQWLEALLDSASALLALTIAPDHRPGVLHYLGVAAAMADEVQGLSLGVHDEGAVTFVPVIPVMPAELPE